MTVVAAHEFKARQLARTYDLDEAEMLRVTEVWSRMSNAVEGGGLSQADKLSIAEALRTEYLTATYGALENWPGAWPPGLTEAIKARIRRELAGLIPDEILDLAFDPDGKVAA